MYKVNNKILKTPVSEQHLLLLEPDTGFYFELNETSVVIFQLINKGKNVQEIVTHINRDYAVSVDQAKIDVTGLIEDLLAHNIIHIND